MIVLVLYKSIQRAVDSVIFAGLDLNGDGGQAVVIIDQIIDLAFVSVIVIKQLATVSGQFLGHNAFIYGTEIDPCLVVQDRADIVAVQDIRQKSHIVQIKLEQIFTDRLRKWKYWCGDRIDVQGDASRD